MNRSRPPREYTGSKKWVPVPRGHLTVLCWCMRRIVIATENEIINGVTRSCGHPSCHKPCEVSR